MESNYSKLYAGSFIVVQLITQNLEKQGITPIVKDETESATIGWFWNSHLWISRTVCTLE